MIPDQTISVKINKFIRKRYIKLGYLEAEANEYIDVNIKDLKAGSHYIIRVICDSCGHEYWDKYNNITQRRRRFLTDKDCCGECGNKNRKKTCLKRYGVEFPFQSKEMRDKSVSTHLEKYGVEHPSQIPENVAKTKQTNLQRYGNESSVHNSVINKKARDTCLKRYGVEYPMQCEEIRKKRVNTYIKKYGVDNPSKCEKIREKVANSYFLSGDVSTSSQQIMLFGMINDLGYNAILNYPVSSLNLDIAIFINDKKIDIEYDGWYWHQDIAKDIARNKVLIKYGWNIIRVLSGELLPEKEQLQRSINNVLSENKQVQLIRLNDWKNNDKKEVI